jgi:superfamily II DNA helicase RecQ
LQVIGFTATATPFVRNDIIKQLALPVTVKQFLSSFNRSNLFFQVRFKESNTNDAYEDMVSVIESFKDKTSGIMYLVISKI